MTNEHQNNQTEQRPVQQNPGSQVAQTGPWQTPVRHPGENIFSDLFGVNHLLSLFDAFPGTNRHFQAARWGLESSERLDDGTQMVKFNLAGWKKEEVNVSLNTAQNRLTITAERKNKDDRSYERRDFSSTISVPAGTTKDRLKVAHEDGILTLQILPTEDDTEHTYSIPVE